MRYDELSSEEKLRLRDAYEAGFAAGSGRPWLIRNDPETIAFVLAVAEDWLYSPQGEPIETGPDWLQALPDRQQAEIAEVAQLLETAPLRGRRPL